MLVKDLLLEYIAHSKMTAKVIVKDKACLATNVSVHFICAYHGMIMLNIILTHWWQKVGRYDTRRWQQTGGLMLLNIILKIIWNDIELMAESWQILYSPMTTNRWIGVVCHWGDESDCGKGSRPLHTLQVVIEKSFKIAKDYGNLWRRWWL